MTNPSKAPAGNRGLERIESRLGVLLVVLGLVALVGPIERIDIVTRIIGVIFTAAGCAGLVTTPSRPHRSTRRVASIWFVMILLAGVLILFNPVHGLLSVGLVLGVSLLVHGAATAAMAFLHQSLGRTARLLVYAGGAVVTVSGVAMLFGEPRDVRWDSVLVGIDLVVFGLVLIFVRIADAIDPPPPAE